jgi:hypothetical protein
MPIRDPGNAGTASQPERYARGSAPILDDDRRRRTVALGLTLATLFVLLPAIVATTLTGEWRWLLGGLGAWVALAVVASGYASYRYGRRL